MHGSEPRARPHSQRSGPGFPDLIRNLSRPSASHPWPFTRRPDGESRMSSATPSAEPIADRARRRDAAVPRPGRDLPASAAGGAAGRRRARRRPPRLRSARAPGRRDAVGACPLMAHCLYEAVVRHDVAGYAAGTTAAQRVKIRALLGISVEPENLDTLAGVIGRQPAGRPRRGHPAAGRQSSTRAWSGWRSGLAARCPP